MFINIVNKAGQWGNTPYKHLTYLLLLIMEADKEQLIQSILRLQDDFSALVSRNENITK